MLCPVGYYASRQGCNPDEWSTSVVCACDIPIDIKLVVFVNAVLVFLRAFMSGPDIDPGNLIISSPCFYRVIETLVKVWENSKKLWKHSQFLFSQTSTRVSITR